MLHYNSSRDYIEIYGNNTDQNDWVNLCDHLKNKNIQMLSFHYVTYFPCTSMSNDHDLIEALNQAKNLRSISIKGSSFHFANPKSQGVQKNGLGILLDNLHNCQELEELTIRNYGASELNKVFDNLSSLIQHNVAIKKISLWHTSITGKNFALLCNTLAQSGRAIEIDFEHDVNFSEENKVLLKSALKQNKLIKVSSNIKQMLDKIVDTNDETIDCNYKYDTPRELQSNSTSNVSDSSFNFLILGGFVEILGISAVCIAFVVLNAATCGLGGILAGVGVAAILTGIGLFALSRYQAANESCTFQNSI